MTQHFGRLNSGLGDITLGEMTFEQHDKTPKGGSPRRVPESFLAKNE